MVDEKITAIESLSDDEKWQLLSRREKLGELLVKFNHLSLEQLKELLEEQESSGKPIGQIIVSRGILTMDQILNALKLQHQSDKVSMESIIELQTKHGEN